MRYSKTQIIATIGPASGNKKILEQMARHQMDVARLNFSWGSHATHLTYIQNIRSVSKKIGKKIIIIQDLSGPRIQRRDGHEFNSVSKNIITEKDIRDLQFGLKNNVDYIAMSYIGNARDVRHLKMIIHDFGKNTPVIAKIERRSALKNLREIIAVSDAIMIARGDLGNEIPFEQIPFEQARIIHECKKTKTPVIVATHMLFSMTEHPEPTRAEISDVAFAVIGGADAIMLSEETARGKYPLGAVAMMEKIACEAEKYIPSHKMNSL